MLGKKCTTSKNNVIWRIHPNSLQNTCWSGLFTVLSESQTVFFILAFLALSIICSSFQVCEHMCVQHTHRHKRGACWPKSLGHVSSVSKAATWTAYLITFCTDLLVTCHTVVNLPFKSEIPDWTGGDVGVTSGHLPNHGVESSVFMHFQEVSWWREDGRLIGIFDGNFDRGRVFKGPPAAETWVSVDIGSLYLQCVGFFGLKIQRLLRNDKDERFLLMTTAARTNVCNTDGWSLCAFKPICES